MAASSWVNDRVWVTVATLTLVVLHVPPIHGECKKTGTTPGIRELLIGKCTDYQTRINPDNYCQDGVSTKRNCTELADLLISAVAYQPRCNVGFSRYEEFFRKAGMTIPSGKAMFWSGTGRFSRRFSSLGYRFTVAGDTLIGYMTDRVDFCSSPDYPGLLYNEDCPGFYPTATCPQPPMYVFWTIVSQQFAAQTKGEAYLMLNASREQAFRNNSVFSVTEIPYLNPAQITTMNIWLVHTPGQKILSNCESANIMELKRRLRERGISYYCDDYPRRAQSMICVDYPDAEECQKETILIAGGSYNTMGLRNVVLLTFTAIVMWYIL